MIEKAMRPMIPKPMIRLAGPPFVRAPPDPTRRPGPIIPARAITVKVRCDLKDMFAWVGLDGVLVDCLACD